ncbi:hypothetical protein C7M84_021119 [Penaeus vannamei]|uniref:Uncharacterized protein n=1 Tax=Penaeus vannamei TaxID=6689 RepID=A0A3R7MKF2_PENVA|nr:hypothetical protein C7M84_021119 [Penaeus vannamei]
MSSPLLDCRALVRNELAAAEEEREKLEQHEESLAEEYDALNESRTSLLNASACERTDESLHVPSDAKADPPGNESEIEQLRHGDSLAGDLESLYVSRTSLLNVSAHERTDDSMPVPVDAEYESSGDESEVEQDPTPGISQEDPSKA